MGKLLPKINGGGGGGCPILVLGISRSLYVDEDTVLPVVLKKKRTKRGRNAPALEEDDDEC
jgi:hypothetical protein